jgi:hypothetical protein
MYIIDSSCLMVLSAILARELRNAEKPPNGSDGFAQTGYLLSPMSVLPLFRE